MCVILRIRVTKSFYAVTMQNSINPPKMTFYGNVRECTTHQIDNRVLEGYSFRGNNQGKSICFIQGKQLRKLNLFQRLWFFFYYFFSKMVFLKILRGWVTVAILIITYLKILEILFFFFWYGFYFSLMFIFVGFDMMSLIVGFKMFILYWYVFILIF